DPGPASRRSAVSRSRAGLVRSRGGLAMTRARWIMGALIGVGALAVAGDALASYLAERLIVGVVAVLGLAGVLAIGFASLTRAQRYVARELAALGAEPPGG